MNGKHMRIAEFIEEKINVQKKWVGLTDEDRCEIRKLAYSELDDISDAIEAKLKEKNT